MLEKLSEHQSNWLCSDAMTPAVGGQTTAVWAEGFSDGFLYLSDRAA